MSKAGLPSRSAGRATAEDFVALLTALATKANTIWKQTTYPFAKFGKEVSIHYTCDVRRSCANRISIGDSVYLAPDVWLNVPERTADAVPAIILGDGCRIGRRCMITAKNSVCLEAEVLLGPSVLIADHGHEFSDIGVPIHAQGLTPGGTVRLERNCWIGYGAAVVCTSGELVIGQNSVIGANSVVTQSVPPFSVVAGNPGKIVRQYDKALGKWVRLNASNPVGS